MKGWDGSFSSSFHFVLFYFIVNRRLCFSSLLTFLFHKIMYSFSANPFFSVLFIFFMFFPCEKGPVLDGPGGFRIHVS